MTPEPFYLWRYVYGKLELVAIVNDKAMAMWWAIAARPGERRHWTRFDVGAP